jgi:hypothetical protein
MAAPTHRLFDSFWPKAADEARLIVSINRIPGFVGPYLLAQATFSSLMIVATVWFIAEMRKVADFSQPGKLMLQPDSLFLAPVGLGIGFGIAYIYNGFSGSPVPR